MKVREDLLTDMIFFSETLKTEIIIKPFFIKALAIFSPSTEVRLSNFYGVA